MDLSVPCRLEVGGLSRPDLMAALDRSEAQLNESATRLLEDSAFDQPSATTIQIVEWTVADLGLPSGAVLSTILAAAHERGLRPCPIVTGPYLRLEWMDQTPASGRVTSTGHAPSGSITVVSTPIRDDDDYPKGFYLRVVDGRRWLRGYRCSDRHQWSPNDRLAFDIAPSV